MNKSNVKDFLREYKPQLKVLNIDIAHSEIQDKWFVFRTSSIYVTNFDYFVEVEDEADLVNVILSELSYDMLAELGLEDEDLPEIPCEEKNIAEMIGGCSKRDYLPEILALLTYIKENVSGPDSELMNRLESLVNKKK